MRKEAEIKNNWFFTKEAQKGVPESAKGWEKINIPHTWNAFDGQDGGADYDRGEYWYFKELEFFCIRPEKLYYLEFGGVASKCKVYFNEKLVCEHKGGYSKFRAEITQYIKSGKNKMAVQVSNKPENDIYPQMADFTFFGGIHRGVKLIEVCYTHFDLDYYGACGLEAYSEIYDDDSARLHINSYPKNTSHGDSIRYTLYDRDGRTVLELCRDAKKPEADVNIEHIHLWQGLKNPYLYKLCAEIVRNNQVLDSVCVTHGFRSFFVDSEKGFYLNGEKMPLRGVSRHGDKLDRGLALESNDHKLDAELIREVGANTVRLAHYQHDEEFYDLCDRYGFVAWAEIPFISKMNEDREAHENCISQLKELIYQNFNHPSICFWGISNEITIGGVASGLVSNLRELNDLVHEIDKTRLSTMAQVSMLPMDDEQNTITDIMAYNHYFGWYTGDLSDNEKWLDEFHDKYPDCALGLSEYGCEGIVTYHARSPRAGDYSEEYQALYHEHMLKVLSEREWIWGSYVWNMFDFGCDARDEGGVKGRNNKGLVSYDRKLKKDSFYICKAYWSAEPFVHICSKRYSQRAEECTNIKVYSNCENISLKINGEKIDAKKGRHVFEFCDVPLRRGANTVSASAGIYSDTAVIFRVEHEPEYYTLIEEEAHIANWFDIADEMPPELSFADGYYSVRHTIRDILDSQEAGDVFVSFLTTVSGMRIKKTMLMMMADGTPESMILGSVGNQKTADEVETALRQLNAKLQNIKITKSGER